MRTTLRTANGYSVDIEQVDGLGAPWIVRAYRKFSFLRRRISSDWFLNSEQARAFADELVRDLAAEQSSPSGIQHRKPGWTLHRPVH